MSPTSFTLVFPSVLVIREPSCWTPRLNDEHVAWLNEHIGEGLWSSRWVSGIGNRDDEGMVMTFLYPDDAMRYKLTFSEVFK